VSGTLRTIWVMRAASGEIAVGDKVEWEGGAPGGTELLAPSTVAESG
jgi:hypothetical protein